MRQWSDFPAWSLSLGTPLFRIHQRSFSPAWFNNDGTWRFDPPPSHRSRFGTCYLGLDPLASYVEVFGRFRTIPHEHVQQRALSTLSLPTNAAIADLTERTVLGDYGVTAAHSSGSDYQPAQELSATLHDAGFAGIRYRIRHDPAMQLEAIALFGDPGETPDRFSPSWKTADIPKSVIDDARRIFHIMVVPSRALP